MVIFFGLMIVDLWSVVIVGGLFMVTIWMIGVDLELATTDPSHAL